MNTSYLYLYALGTLAVLAIIASVGLAAVRNTKGAKIAFVVALGSCLLGAAFFVGGVIVRSSQIQPI